MVEIQCLVVWGECVTWYFPADVGFQMMALPEKGQPAYEKWKTIIENSADRALGNLRMPTVGELEQNYP